MGHSLLIYITGLSGRKKRLGGGEACNCTLRVPWKDKNLILKVTKEKTAKLLSFLGEHCNTED